MIPDVPLLKRASYDSAYSGVEFNPFTLFVRYPLKGLVQHPFTGRGSASVHMQIDTVTNTWWHEILKIDSEAAAFHEEFHWLQYNGTSVGAFLSLLRYSQERTTVNLLKSMGTDYLTKLFKNRTGENPIPIVPINDEGKLDFSLFPERDEADLFRQIWYDHELIYTLFDSSNKQDYISYPRGQIFGEIVGDTILHFCDRCGYAYPGTKLAREWYRFNEESILFVASNGERLTTRAVIEGATVANELQLLVLRQASHELVTKLVDRLDHGTYGIALLTFMGRLGLDPQNVMSILPTFNTICDLALNPPLPPLHIGGPKDNDHWSWEDIYPPLRFQRTIDCIKKLGFLPYDSNHERLCGYIDALCGMLHWPSPNNFVHPYKKCKQKLNLETRKRDYQLQQLENYDYYHYLFWVQYEMWKKRKTHLPAFINQAEMRCSENLWNYYSDIYFGDMVSEGYNWIKPPFWSTLDSYGHRQSKCENFNYWLVSNSCLHYLLFDLVVGTGKFDIAAYPPQMRVLSIFDKLRQGLERTFGVQIEEELLKSELPDKPLFAPGQIVGTPNVILAFERNNVKPDEFIKRHLVGDWGKAGNYYDITLTKKEHKEGADATDDDGKLNKWGVEHNGTIRSFYTLPDQTKFYIETVGDRSYTVICLPSER